MLNILSIMMFVFPAFFALVIHNHLSSGKMDLKRKAIYLFLYFFLLNLCTLFVSYLRGIKGLRFDGMTLSYRLKYLALGSMLGLVMPFIVHFIMQKVDYKKISNRIIKFINLYIITNVILLFIVCRGIYISFFMNGVNRALWLDEAYLASSFSKRSFLGIFLDGEFEYLQSAPLMWLWFEKILSMLFGNTPYVLRMGAVISFVLTLTALSCIQFYYFHSKFPFAAAALIANTPFILKYSNMFKPYMTDCLVTLLVVIFFGLWEKERLSSKWLAIIWMGLIWCSQPVCFMIGGLGLSEFIFSCIHKNKKEILRIILLGMFVGIGFIIYYFVWIRRMTSISEMQDVWSSYFFPFIPESLSEIRIGSDLLLDQVFANFDTAYYFVFVLSIGGIVYSIMKKNRLIIGLYLGLLIALFASYLHMYPVKDRLWCFSYPVLALIAFTTLEGIVQKKTMYEGVMAFVLLVVVFGNTGYKKYSEASNIYMSGEELGLELEYLTAHMKPDDTVYVYSHSIPAFEYINGYGELDFGEGTKNVVFGTPWKSKIDWKEEVNKIVLHSNIWIVSSHINDGKFSEFVQDIQENGYLELVNYQYNTPLWHYCSSLDDVKKHFTMTVEGTVLDSDGWSETTIHIKNDGEAYLNNPYENIYLIEKQSGKIYPIDELIAPGDEIDIVVRYPKNEEPEYTLCGQYGKITNDNTIKITEEMIVE